MVGGGAEKVNKKRRPLLRKSMRSTFAGLPVNVMRNPHIHGQCFAEFGKYLCISVMKKGGGLSTMSKKLPPPKKPKRVTIVYYILHTYYYIRKSADSCCGVVVVILEAGDPIPSCSDKEKHRTRDDLP